MIRSVNKENRFVLPTATSREPEVSGNITVTTGCGQKETLDDCVGRRRNLRKGESPTQDETEQLLRR